MGGSCRGRWCLQWEVVVRVGGAHLCGWCSAEDSKISVNCGTDQYRKNITGILIRRLIPA